MWEIVKQLGFDLKIACARFGADAYQTLTDPRVRELRRCVRIGQRYAARHEREGNFNSLKSADVVAINIENGEFVVGSSELEASDAFEKRYGEHVWAYMHPMTPYQVSRFF